VAVWRNIVLNRVRRGIAGGQTNILPVDGVEDRCSSLDVCSRQRSLLDGNLWTGGSWRRRRDLWKTADRQHGANLCEMIIACGLIIHRLLALLMTRA